MRQFYKLFVPKNISHKLNTYMIKHTHSRYIFVSLSIVYTMYDKWYYYIFCKILFRSSFQVASVAYDYLPVTGVLSRLYQNDVFIEFLRDVLGLPALYRLEDPFGACSINLFKPGKQFLIEHSGLNSEKIWNLRKSLLGTCAAIFSSTSE